MTEPFLQLEERQQLEELLALQEAQAYHRRAQIILLYDEGYPTRQVAQAVGLSRGRSRYWRHRFQLDRMAMFASAYPDSSNGGDAAAPSPMPAEESAEIAADDIQSTAAPGLISAELKLKAPGVLPDDTLAEAGRKVLRFHFSQMLRHEAGTQLGEDIEELHDMRVATRRMRAAFEVFEGAFTQKAIKSQLKGLRAAGRALGRVRDLDVFMEKAYHYADTLPEERRPGLQPLLQAWMNARQEARSVMVKYLDSGAYQNFKGRFDGFVNTPGVGVRPQKNPLPTPHLVRDVAPALIYERLASVRAFDSVLSTATLEQFHALRIEFKKLRYTLEFFREVLGSEAGAVIEEIKAMQDHLGDLNDAQVATQILRDFLQEWDTQQAALPVVERTAPAPVLDYLSVRYAERQDLEHSFRQAWEHFNQPALRQNLAQAVSVL